MHIGLVIYGDLNVISGGYLYDKQLVNYWRANGHRVTIFSRPWRSYWRHFSDNLLQSWRQELVRADLDVLVQDELNHPSLIGLNRAIKQEAGYPIVSLVHLLRCTEPHPAVAKRFYRAVEKRYLGQMDGLILNSFDTAAAVKPLIPDDMPQVVAYPGRDHWQIEIDAAQIEQRAMSAGPLNILYVGNLIKRKGLLVLIRALSQLDPASWRLTAIGRQDLEPAYVRQIQQTLATGPLQNNVNLVGSVPFEQMAAYFKRHQLFVMPSFYEPFGIVYIEAMGAGLPVIASTAGAGRELVTPGENGFLVTADDSDQIAQHIRQLAGDRRLLTHMSLQSRQRYERHPTWGESGANITAFLETLVLGR